MGIYRRLTLRDRYQIELLKGKGVRNSVIARELKVHPATISREVKRTGDFYCATKALKMAAREQGRRSLANRKICGSIKRRIDELILGDWSPEQIENELKLNKIKISYKTIYRYIERDKLSGGNLKSHLRILRKQRKDRKKPQYRPYQGLINDRVPISKRPKIVEKRSRIGDYERDTMFGSKGGQVILAVVDRKTRYLHLAAIKKNCAELVHQATLRVLKNRNVKTITNDNGSEFAFHIKTAKALKTKIYFSRSYAAWERGTNENTIGLLRQYLPRKKPFPKLTPALLRKLESTLNNRPKKCLGFNTPAQLYNQKPGQVLR
jgi:IS30 family transposase